MNTIRNKYAYVLKCIKKDKTLLPFLDDLSGKTFLISGGSRGIGLDIGKKLYESFEFKYTDSLIQLENFFDINYQSVR